MNTFVKIVPVEEMFFEKVNFYSVNFFDKTELNEYEDFINRHIDIIAVEEDLVNLQLWIDKIGQEIGAKKEYFRHEGETASTSALPPPRRKLAEIPVEDLRLYCMVISENIVIIFNGGIKTANLAQDCPNVKKYFRQANQLTKAIDNLIVDGDLKIDSEGKFLIFEPDLEIEV